MFFQYLGSEPLDVQPPGQHLGHQNKFTIMPSANGQHTNNEVLYNWLFDEAFPEKDLFKKVTGFHLVQEEIAYESGNVYDKLAHTSDYNYPQPIEMAVAAEKGDD